MARTLINGMPASGQDGAARSAPAPGLPMLVGGALVVLVVLAHAMLIKAVADGLTQMAADAAVPPRVQIRYVREMAVASPAAIIKPTGAPAPTKPPPPTTGAPRPRVLPEVGAQQREGTATDTTADLLPEAVTQAASAAQAVAPAAPPAAGLAAASAPTGTETAELTPQTREAEQEVDSVWPQTTRVSYVAHGYYRGEVHGSATVEWVRQGDRYQMHMDVRMGAGAFRWSTSSRGRITEQGVRPEQFDQTRGVVFSSKHLAVKLGERQIEFANGQQVARPVDVQDINSQFVQMTYLFTTRKELTAPGQQIAFPLAFERGLRAYAYQVKGHEVLQTPLGALAAVHAVPQRLQGKEKDLVAQAWFAPQLHYLPIRIQITLGEETYIELNISKAPELAR